MRTFEHNGTVFNYNSDFSGDIYIRGKNGIETTTDKESIIAILSQGIRNELISKIESMEFHKLLKFLMQNIEYID